MKRTTFKIEKASNGFIVETSLGIKTVHEKPEGVATYIADSLVNAVDFEKPLATIELTIREE